MSYHDDLDECYVRRFLSKGWRAKKTPILSGST